MGIKDYIIESEKENLIVEEELKQQTGAEIAKELGITRQAVSNTLKRAMKKVYKETRKIDKTWSPFEVAVVMSQIFKVDEVELAKFIRLFPPDIRKEIESSATEKMPELSKR